MVPASSDSHWWLVGSPSNTGRLQNLLPLESLCVFQRRTERRTNVLLFAPNQSLGERLHLQPQIWTRPGEHLSPGSEFSLLGFKIPVFTDICGTGEGAGLHTSYFSHGNHLRLLPWKLLVMETWSMEPSTLLPSLHCRNRIPHQDDVNARAAKPPL